MNGWVLQAVLVAQLVGSTGMFGVIWVIQLVHYPLMKKVPAGAFGAFEAEHQRRITYVVGPLMALEGLSVLAVFFFRPSCLSFAIVLAGGLVEAIAIGTTAFVSAPMHGRMAASGSPQLLDRLIATNWIRTAAWTIRAALAITMFAICR
jgi:hypothetical protein